MNLDFLEEDFFAITDYCVTGDKDQLKSLYQTMKDLEDSREAIKRSVGYRNNFKNLAVTLGDDEENDDLWGTWSRLSLADDFSMLHFSVDTHGKDPDDFVDFIKSRFPGLEVYFRCYVLFGEHNYTNDRDGVFFQKRFVVEVDGIEDRHYFYTKEEAKEYIESLIGRNIEPGEDFNSALFEWGEFRAELPIYFEYEII